MPAVLLSLLTLCVVGLTAAPAPAEPAGPSPLALQRARLPGGLRVVMNVDRSAPVVVAVMSYLAGPVDDPPRRSGTARLVERMMFAGGGQVGDGQHAQSIAALGGFTTVARTAEVTSYINVVPPEGLPLALWLEGQRLASLTVGDVPLARERQRLLVTRDEQRWRDAATVSRRRLVGLALQGTGRHGGATLNALDTITAAEVKAFHQRFYGPERAVLTVVGDFDPDVALAAAKRYVDPIRRPTAPRRPGRIPPDQTTRRVSSLLHRGAHRGMLACGWPIVGRDHPDHPALEVAGQLLAGGRASALHQQLVVADGRALGVKARSEQLDGHDLLGVYVELPRGTTPHDAAAIIEREASRLGQQGPQPAALQRAQRALQVGQLRELASATDRAHRLGAHELTRRDATELTALLARHQAVTAADVRRVAARYLVPHRSSVVESFAVTIPTPPGAAGAQEDKGKAKPTKTQGKATSKSKKSQGQQGKRSKGKQSKGSVKSKKTKGKASNKSKKSQGKQGKGSAKKPARRGKGR